MLWWEEDRAGHEKTLDHHRSGVDFLRFGNAEPIEYLFCQFRSAVSLVWGVK